MMFPMRFVRAFKDEWTDIASLLNNRTTLRGPLAQRPAGGHEGLYVATDLPGVIYWDGAAWRKVSDDSVVV